eukprot:scaffold94723_cov60-Phaeocystis_antarctica.AAC.1
MPGSSGWLGGPRGASGPLGPQPPPRVLKLAASKAADFRAFDHPGPTPTSTSSSGARRRWRP